MDEKAREDEGARLSRCLYLDSLSGQAAALAEVLDAMGHVAPPTTRSVAAMWVSVKELLTDNLALQKNALAALGAAQGTPDDVERPCCASDGERLVWDGRLRGHCPMCKREYGVVDITTQADDVIDDGDPA